MKRFLLFVGEEYYPCGGWHDFRGAFDTAEEAKRAVFEPRDSANGFWWHVVDTETMQEVSF